MSWLTDLKYMTPNLLAVTGVIILIMLFPYGLLYFLIAITIPFIIKDLIMKVKPSVKGILTSLLIGTIFFYTIKFLGGKGLWGLITIVIGFSLYKLYKSRKYYMAKIREIEMLIWGRTNDKKK